MSNIAVINLGGSQHIVKAGDKLEVNRLSEEVGNNLKPEILLSTKGADVLFNDGAIEAKVVEHKRGEKIYVRKFKAKSRYQRRTGHRQELTVLEVLSVNGEKTESKAAKSEKPAKTSATKEVKPSAKAEPKKKVAKGDKKTIAKKTTKKTK